MPHALTDQHQVMVREKRRVAMTSVLAAIFLTSAKLGVGLWTGSLGILSEAAHSGLDLLAAAITWFAVNMSDRPADAEHQYGHGKIENLSALAETLLLLLTCVWILYEAWSRLMYGHGEIEVNAISFAVIGGSIIVDFGRSRALSRVAKKYHSQALEADALHFSTDIWSSIVVIIGLVLVQVGFPAGDSIAAACVAFIVIWISFQLGRRTIDVLLDRIPAGIQDAVTGALATVPDIESVRGLRIRQAGAHHFIELVIGMKRSMSFDQAHAVMDTVERVVHEAVPRADVMIHAEPVIAANERVTDSVQWLIQQHGLNPHNILVLTADGRLNIDLDIEFPPGTNFADAHATSVAIEEHIRREIPDLDHVLIHLEEERPALTGSKDVTVREAALVVRIGDLVGQVPAIGGCEFILVHETDKGLKISMACSLDASLSLDDAHTVVNALENDIVQLDPRITKVFIHAEPTGRA